MNEKWQGRLRLVGLVPVAIIAILAVSLALIGFRGPVFDIADLALVLQFIFVFCVSLLLAVVSARAYYKSGSFNILLLGTAPMVSGILLMVAQWAVTPSLGSMLTPNEAVTIGNLGILIASFLLMIGAILLPKRTEQLWPDTSRKIVLGGSFLVAIVLIVGAIFISTSGSLPVFFTSNGSTVWRLGVLAISGAFLAISCGLFGWTYIRTKSPTLYWYSLGLLSFATALIGIVFTVKIGESVNWCGRLGLYLSGFFFLMSVLVRNTGEEEGNSISERWASAFRNDREQVNNLFANMTELFFYGKIVTDNDGNPIDFIYLDVNQAWETHNSLKFEDVQGRRSTEVFPAVKNEPNWIDPYGRAALSRESIIFEKYSPVTNKWYHINVYSPKKGYFVSITEDITKRKKAEEALIKSEETLAAFFDASPGILTIEDEEFRYIRTDGQTPIMFGLDRQSIIGRSTEDLAPGLNDKVRGIKSRVIETGEPTLNVEVIGPSPSRPEEIGYWRASYFPVPLPEGKRGVGVMGVDTTEQKKAEEALKESEAKYRDLFRSMTEAFQLLELIYDGRGKVTDARIIDVNPAFELLTGLKKENMIGKNIKQIFGVIEDYWLEIYQKVVETGEPAHYENHGGELDRHFDLSIWRAAGGRCAITSMDVTEIRRAQEALQVEKDRLASLFNSMSDEVWVANEQGKLIMINPAVTKDFNMMVGPEGIEVVKVATSLEVLRPDGSERPPEEAPLTRALKGEAVNCEEEIIRIPTSGEYRHRQVNAAPIKDVDGHILGAVSVVRDVTERKKMEAELKRSNHELQQFAYLSSHDLQEPLRMMVSYMSLLERKYKGQLDPQAHEYISHAINGGTRMRQLIDDLLVYSRVETTAKESTPVNMKEVVEDTIKVLKVQIEESKADIYIDPMPTIMADGSQIHQVMQNLISNSLKFHGPERPMVHISAREGIKEWTFSVRDNGIGMNMEYAGKIFQMFQRLHTKEEYPGTGVGLAIAKKIVERHGGSIWVESEEGRGATFYFTIPVSPRKND